MNLRKIYNIRNKKHNIRKISFNTMLNSEYFFHNSGQIQMALNKLKIIDDDFHVKRVKSTLTRLRQPNMLDSSQKKQKEQRNTSFSEKEKDKKQLPLQLGKILDDNEQKFSYISKKYNILKDQNNKFLNYWHYIKKSDNNNKKNQKNILLNKYLEKIEKYFVNLNSDEVKKMTEKLFKSNPLLMYRNSSDMFFHFLSEIYQHKNDEKKLDYIMKKHLMFLEKINDFLEFSKIKNDTSVDEIAKDIKLKNSDYLTNYNLKVAIEEQKLKDQKYKQNINDINDSLKMINETKKSIKRIEENKKFFEDPKYLMDTSTNDYNQTAFYNSYSNLNFRNLNQSAKNTANKMNSTISTGFNIIEKENSKKQQKGYRNSITGKMRNSISMIVKKKAGRKSVVYSNSMMEKGMYERIISSKLGNYNNKMPEINKGRNEKINLKKKLNRRQSTGEYIKISSNKSLNENKNKKELNKEDSIQSNSNSRKETPTNINNNVLNNKLKKFRRCNSVIKINKNRFLLNDKNDAKSSTIFNKNNLQRKASKNYSRNNKSMIANKKAREYQLTNLYNKTKNKKKISSEEMQSIIDYFKNVGMEVNKREIKPIDLINRAKFMVNRLDIDKNTSKVLQQNISHKLPNNLKIVKDMNQKINELDCEFVKNVIFFKAKNENDEL